MRFFDRLSCKCGCTESRGEAVSGSNGIGNLYSWRLLERLCSRCKDITSVDTTGQYEHLQIVLTEDEPAFVLHVQARIAEKSTDSNQFFVVDFQDITGSKRLFYNLLGVEILSKIDVKDLQTVLWSGRKKALNGVA